MLGNDGRLRATMLPYDQWMLERIRSEETSGAVDPPVAWHGRFHDAPHADDIELAPTPAPPVDLVMGHEQEPRLDTTALASTPPLTRETIETSLDPEVRAVLDDLERRARSPEPTVAIDAIPVDDDDGPLSG